MTENNSTNKDSKINIYKGLPKKHIGSVTDLLLSELGEKFIPILGEKEKAKQLLELSINQENCFFVERDSKLLGFLAFQINNTVFVNSSLSTIISIYGVISGTIKAIDLKMLEHKTNSSEIHIEAIVVSKQARGLGIGTKLIDTIFQFANQKGYKTITLEVIDTNPRAKDLYKRLGFKVDKKSNIWPINKLIGWPFNEIFLMEKDLSRENK